MLTGGCRRVVCVFPGSHIDSARRLTSDLPVQLVEGGETRQESVLNALLEVEDSRVVVHDAARPLAGSDLVGLVIGTLGDADACVPVVAVGETVKRVADGRIAETVSRDRLVVAQTPQAFATERLVAAHRRAQTEGVAVTDDAELIERYGGVVTVVEGSRRNLKLTFPEDLSVAEAMIRR